MSTGVADVDYAQWSASMRLRIESKLSAAIDDQPPSPTRLIEAMRYATLGGGKRIRALLAYAAHGTYGASVEALDHVACAVEMIHAYSLIHDDLPCMDNDVLRRGRPTCHIQYDEATAMLAGDALQPLAFGQLVSAPVSDAQRVALTACLVQAAGAYGMAGGQAMDLFSVGRSLSLAELETMHALKTGALIHASVMMGIVCAPEVPDHERAAVSRYAELIGLAFQVVDDILDVEGTVETLGKTAGKDAAENKPTFVSVLGLAGAKHKAAQLTAAAREALSPLGSRAAFYQGIADEVLQRQT